MPAFRSLLRHIDYYYSIFFQFGFVLFYFFFPLNLCSIRNRLSENVSIWIINVSMIVTIFRTDSDVTGKWNGYRQPFGVLVLCTISFQIQHWKCSSRLAAATVTVTEAAAAAAAPAKIKFENHCRRRIWWRIELQAICKPLDSFYFLIDCLPMWMRRFFLFCCCFVWNLSVPFLKSQFDRKSLAAATVRLLLDWIFDIIVWLMAAFTKLIHDFCIFFVFFYIFCLTWQHIDFNGYKFF